MWQLSTLECRQRIVEKQCAGFLHPKLVDDHVIGRLQTQRALPRIVGVTRDKMNEPLADPLQRIFLRHSAEVSREGAAGNLHEAALSHPLLQALRMGLQDAVALRMSDDGPHAAE